MGFATLRHELHSSSNLDEVVSWLLDHAQALCAEFDCITYPVMMSYHHVTVDKDLWRFYLWMVGNGHCDVFVRRVLPALGFHIVWAARSEDARHGYDADVQLIKYDWPVMRYCERLGGSTVSYKMTWTSNIGSATRSLSR